MSSSEDAVIRVAQIQRGWCPCAAEARHRHGGEGQVTREAESAVPQPDGRGHHGRPATADTRRAAGAEPAPEPQRARGSGDTLILYLALAEFREMKCLLLGPASAWCLVGAATGDQYSPIRGLMVKTTQRESRVFGDI